jgi:hypothetical protein
MALILLMYLFFRPSTSSNTHNSSSSNPGFKAALADVNNLPQSGLFTYLNLTSQIFINETQGILFVPPHDRPGHFASIVSNGVRGNHRHTDKENSISGEVLVLMHGIFLFRVAEGDSDKYEDHRFNITETGVLAIQFTADKCHALKNIGKQTCWFGSYAIKLKHIPVPFVDKQSCLKMVLT